MLGLSTLGFILVVPKQICDRCVRIDIELNNPDISVERKSFLMLMKPSNNEGCGRISFVIIMAGQTRTCSYKRRFSLS